MVQQQIHPQTYSTFCYKTSQRGQNVKVHGKSLALVTPKAIFDQLLSHTTEKTKNALMARKEADKLIALKSATYKMSKNWENTVENIKKQRKEELLSKRKQEKTEREKIAKNVAMKKEVERAEVIERAKRLLFYREPYCKLINGALLKSECLKELASQRNFEKMLKRLDKEQDILYAANTRKEIEKEKEEERKRTEKEIRKRKMYGQQLKKQIEEIKKNVEAMKEAERFAEQEDLKAIAKELELAQEVERKQVESKKMELKKMFTDTIKVKKLYEEQQKQNEKIQEQARQEYLRSKERTKKTLTTMMKKRNDEYRQRIQHVANTFVVVANSCDEKETERIKQIEKNKETKESESRNISKKQSEKIKLEVEKYRQVEADIKKKREKEMKELMEWEALQRIKKNEFDKQMQIQQFENKAKKVKEYAEELRKQFRNKEIDHKCVMDDFTARMQANIKSTNQRILKYGQEVIKESEGVRPLFPIIKAVEQFKREYGLNQPRNKSSTPHHY